MATPPVPPSDIRKDYRLSELHEADLFADPIEQFGKWFADAEDAKIAEPNAMTLATADRGGRGGASCCSKGSMPMGSSSSPTNRARRAKSWRKILRLSDLLVGTTRKAGAH